jgi:DNA polymerase III epsilon subunit-like protein
MKELIIDTETTGLTRLSFANKLNYKKWPRLVQIAWALASEDGIECNDDAIIRPEGFEIPLQATQIHGITHEQAMAEGEDLGHQLKTLNNVMQEADAVVAHNLSFDLGVIESEALRLNYKMQIPDKRFCTVHLGRAYLHKAKGRKQGGYPKLGDLYETLFGFSYGPKHDAQTDTIACCHVYRRLKKLGYIK